LFVFPDINKEFLQAAGETCLLFDCFHLAQQTLHFRQANIMNFIGGQGQGGHAIEAMFIVDISGRQGPDAARLLCGKLLIFFQPLAHCLIGIHHLASQHFPGVAKIALQLRIS
jgi:hypothetical protein